MQQSTTSTHGGEPNILDTQGLCLLSLDGGGVRGLSTLLVLKSIMAQLNYQRTSAGLESLKPCEVFDLIGGTSTGGLIALMLGRLEMDVNECITAYCDLAEAVFGKKESLLPIGLRFNTKAQFSSEKLKSAILKVIEDRIRKVHEGDTQPPSEKSVADEARTLLLNDGIKRGCKTFVCAADRYTKDIVHIRDYALPDEPGIQATIWEAALASSAATTFFEPAKIGDRSFADGGFGANNPADEVEGEASSIWCGNTGDLKPLVKCFISIGTGNPGIQQFEDRIDKFLTETIAQIATETEHTEKKFIARWAKHYDEKRYFRFNVEQGLQGIKLDEYKQKGNMESATENYINHKGQQFKVRDCIQNLALKQNKTVPSFAIDLHEYNQAIIMRKAEAHHYKWIVPFDANSCFTGRQAELDYLNTMLSDNKRTTKIAITGLGGVGKTQLALECLYRWRANDPDCSVFWIPAINMESVNQAYLDVALQLKVPGCEDKDKDLKRLVQKHLNSSRMGRWVLVFDNADDMDLFFTGTESEPGLIEYLPRSKSGAIIFTTRHREIAVRLAPSNVVDVSAMKEREAYQLLKRRLSNIVLDNFKQDADALLKKLTYLPLALVQAAAYIEINRLSLAKYLDLLRGQEEEVVALLSKSIEDEGRYTAETNAIALTWLISFTHIERNKPLAADYISIMACLEPNAIPLSIFPSQEPRMEHLEAIATLRNYSFITERPDGDAVDFHRLVHLATREWLRQQRRLIQYSCQVINRLETIFPTSEQKNRSLWRAYLPHVRYALNSKLVDKSSITKASLMIRFGQCLTYDGRYAEAEDPLLNAVTIYESEPGREDEAIYAMGSLGRMYSEANQEGKAEKKKKQVLEKMIEKYGEDDLRTLTAKTNLAVTFSNQGREKEAILLKKEVLEKRSVKQGPHHKDTLTAKANLAVTYTNLAVTYNDDSWEILAKELKEEVLEYQMKDPGLHDQDTLTSIHSLAITYHNLGLQDDAIKLMEKCVSLRRDVLGDEHPHTHDSLSLLDEWKPYQRLVVPIVSEESSNGRSNAALANAFEPASESESRRVSQGAPELLPEILSPRTDNTGSEIASTASQDSKNEQRRHPGLLKRLFNAYYHLKKL